VIAAGLQIRALFLQPALYSKLPTNSSHKRPVFRESELRCRAL
jgi:hypothetical protein